MTPAGYVGAAVMLGCLAAALVIGAAVRVAEAVAP